MKGLRRNFNGETHILRPNGEVVVMFDGQPAAQGTWRSQASANDEPDNQIRYKIGDVEHEVPIRYRFNSKNQLQAVIPAAANDGTDSEPFTFIGRIVIDDQHDVVYQLIDSEGNDFPRKIVIYGNLEINQRANRLVIHLAGPEGGQAEIRGQRVSARSTSAVEALHNDILEFRGKDLLRFNAVTRNPLEGAAGTVIKRAEIELTGSWDVRDGHVVFASTVKGNLNKPDVTIALAGKFKGISGGLVYVREAASGEKIVFQVEGQHKWNATEAKWDLNLGFSNKTFKAEIEGELERVGPKTGNKLTLKGKASVESSEGQALELDLELNASYVWKNGELIIAADVSTEDGELNYNIGLEGTVTFKSGKLTFGAKYNSAEDKVEIDLEFIGNESSLVDTLRILLELGPDDEVDLTIEFSLQLSWRDGVQIREPLAA